MKTIKYLLFAVFLFVLWPYTTVAKEKIEVYFFHSDSCLHCQHEKEFLEENEDKYNIHINYYEVSSNMSNQRLMSKIKGLIDENNSYVPYLVIGQESFTGFSENIKKDIINKLLNYDYNSCDLVKTYLETGESCKYEEEKEENTSFVIPLLGEIDAKEVSLPFVAVIIGLIDGFNPCAMWVLLFLISVLLGMKNRKRMWVLGLTFILTSAFVYYLIMASWLNIAISFNKIVIVRIIIASLAIIGGLINLKSYFKKGDNGCEVVNDNKRKKIFKRIKKFTSEKTFFLAVIGIMGIAISVNIIELACSAGLPLLFTQILAVNNLSKWFSNILMLLYILFFLLDDLIVFFIAMKTLKLKGISTKYSKYSHLIGGIIMTIIGILLIVKPEWIMFNF